MFAMEAIALSPSTRVEIYTGRQAFVARRRGAEGLPSSGNLRRNPEDGSLAPYSGLVREVGRGQAF